MTKPKNENIKINGKKEAADLLAALDRNSRDRILGDIARKDPALAAELRKGMVSFERVLSLDPMDLQKVIRPFPQELIALAARSLSDQEKLSLFTKMPERQARAIIDEMNSMGPRKLSDVKLAQDRICELARTLSDQGQIKML
jgi:flagellar motor switch protein FliG